MLRSPLTASPLGWRRATRPQRKRTHGWPRKGERSGGRAHLPWAKASWTLSTWPKRMSTPAGC